MTTPADSAPPRTPGFFARRKLAVVLTSIVLLPVLLFTAWAIFTLTYTYSDGTRAGTLQKFSKRGWVCKTWEGELQMSAIPGSAPEKFFFSVRSDSVANEINKLNGRQVVLHYKEHRGVPTSCFGDTDYYVDGVQLMADSTR
jgi:hypothetical protein